MAVGAMLKATIIGHASVLDDVVHSVQRAGVVEIEAEPYDLPPVELAPFDTGLRRINEHAAQASFIRDFLGRYHVPTHALSMFISEKIHVPESTYVDLETPPAFAALYEECEDIADRLASGEREISRLEALVKELEPWVSMRVQISEWKSGDHVVLITGTVPANQGAEIRQALRDVVDEVAVEELGPVGSRAAWMVMAHRCVVDQARSVLVSSGFSEVSFPGLEDYPAEEQADARERIAELTDEASRLEERATELAARHYAEEYALVERLKSARDAILVRRDFGSTERSFVATGWVPEKQRDELGIALGPYGADLDLTLEPPGPEDSPPVILDNPFFLRPFELLTDLYGRPKYGEIDPTPLLAPFFLVYFAICISDVGYGLMLWLGALFIKHRLDVAPGVKRFMDLLMWGGAASMVMGVLTGSYFALPVESLPPFLQSLQVIDPLEDITTLLLVTIALGAVQVFFGVLVAAYDSIRRGDPVAAVMMQLSTIFFFAMIAIAFLVPDAWRWALPVGIGVTMLAQGRALEATFRVSGVGTIDRGWYLFWLLTAFATMVALPLGYWQVALAFVTVSIVAAVLSETARSGVFGFLGGAYSVYGMTSFVGDVLSYTRLAALGLSGVLVGTVFNLLAGLVLDPATGVMSRGSIWWFVGAAIMILAMLIFVVGHTFNVLINLIGAFVHPARLQYVEFFSKFYKAGGTMFDPFGLRTKQLVLTAGENGGKGGPRS